MGPHAEDPAGIRIVPERAALQLGAHPRQLSRALRPDAGATRGMRPSSCRWPRGCRANSIVRVWADTGFYPDLLIGNLLNPRGPFGAAGDPHRAREDLTRRCRSAFANIGGPAQSDT